MRCKCGSMIRKHSKNKMCNKCLNKRKCKVCNSNISAGSRSGLCRSCAQKNKPPRLRGYEKNITMDEIIPRYKVFEFVENNNIEFLREGWQTRKFIKYYPLMYKNILYYSNSKETKNYNLYRKICFILEDAKILIKRNTYEHILFKNGPVQGFIKYNKQHPPAKGAGNLDWHIKKYGENGKKIFKERYSKIIKNLPFSKVSQELFSNLPQGRYATRGGEIRFDVSNYDIDRHFIFADYVYKNKIIEFDGNYWHKNSEKIDKQKDLIYEKLGFKVLRVTEKEYKQDKNKVILKCLKFLNNQ